MGKKSEAAGVRRRNNHFIASYHMLSKGEKGRARAQGEEEDDWVTPARGEGEWELEYEARVAEDHEKWERGRDQARLQETRDVGQASVNRGGVGRGQDRGESGARGGGVRGVARGGFKVAARMGKDSVAEEEEEVGEPTVAVPPVRPGSIRMELGLRMFFEGNSRKTDNVLLERWCARYGNVSTRSMNVRDWVI